MREVLTHLPVVAHAPPLRFRGEDNGRGIDGEDIPKRAHSLRGEELRHGQRTRSGAVAHEHGQPQEYDGGRVVGEVNEHQGTRNAGKNRSM